jgi:hypothetical protein
MGNFFSRCRATTVVDCLESTFDEACQGYMSVRNSIIEKQKKLGNRLAAPKVNHVCNLLEDQKFNLLEPYVNPGVTKLLILETNSPWSCVLANGLHGISSIPHIEMCGERLKTRYVRSVADNTKGSESFQFLYKDFSTPEVAFRYIYTQNEGGWRFSEIGEPLHFEVTDSYKNRKKRDRLTTHLIHKYMNELGIKIDSPNFFTGKGMLFDYPPFPQTKPLPK